MTNFTEYIPYFYGVGVGVGVKVECVNWYNLLCSTKKDRKRIK
jgi:hypothetical protein